MGEVSVQSSIQNEPLIKARMLLFQVFSVHTSPFSNRMLINFLNQRQGDSMRIENDRLVNRNLKKRDLKGLEALRCDQRVYCSEPTFKTGDRVIYPNVSYMAVYRMFHELFNRKFGVETVMVDMTDLEAVKKAITPGTRLVHIETPDNPTNGVTDIEAIVKIAHENGAVVSVDNTFASPINQKPLELGADFVVEALTKFINGHGDAQGGAIISNDLETMDRIRYEAQVNVGSVISPFNAWQIFRGSVTYPLRMQRINESSQRIAQWLEERENVTFVSYPGLPSNPGHELAKRQMKNGYGGVISFGVDTDDKTVERFCGALKVVTFAVSLGHDESLIFPQPSYDERINLYPEKFRKGFIRFSVGLEDPEDIIADLDQALKAVGL